MFTGIVGGRGLVAESRPGRLGIQHKPTAETAAIGASVAVNGVCLTVVETEGDKLRTRWAAAWAPAQAISA